MVCPAVEKEVGDADLTTVIAGDGTPWTVAEDGAEVIGWLAGVWPVAVAVLRTDPASTSAWVTVYVAVQVTEAPGTSAATEPARASATTTPGQVTTGRVPCPVNSVSLMVTGASVTLPVLVTRKL